MIFSTLKNSIKISLVFLFVIGIFDKAFARNSYTAADRLAQSRAQSRNNTATNRSQKNRNSGQFKTYAKNPQASYLKYRAPSFSNNFTSSSIEAEPRTVFVQMFEWTWRDIAKECEIYLGPNGFSAVQVSPPTEHMVWENSPWWERYQPTSYQIISRSGNEHEFKNMIERCKRAGVDVYVDVVFNHMAGIETGTGHAGTQFNHYEYPGLYSYNDFHHCNRNRDGVRDDNILNFGDLYELWNCELVNLADLATESPYVQKTLGEYLNRLLDYNTSGFRVDAAKHMPPQDIQAILRQAKRKVYVVQELIVSPGEPIRASDYLINGNYSVFAYSYDLGRAFKNKELWRLSSIGNGGGYPDSTSGVVFVENHDLQRTEKHFSTLISSLRDGDLFKLSQVFMLAWPYGYPQIFSSFKYNNIDDGPAVDSHRMTKDILSSDGRQCFGNWVCEHRMPEVAAMVQFRNITDSAFYSTNWWTNGSDQMAFGRGDRGHVVINASEKTMKATIQTSMNSGKYCNVLSEVYDVKKFSCRNQNYVTVDNNGRMQVELPPMKALAIHIGARP